MRFRPREGGVVDTFSDNAFFNSDRFDCLPFRWVVYDNAALLSRVETFRSSLSKQPKFRVANQVPRRKGRGIRDVKNTGNFLLKEF